MKKIWLALLLLTSLELCAQQQTTNLGLTIVPHGFPNYDVPVNANMRNIDSAVGLLQNMWQGNWSNASTYGKGQIVIFSSTLYSSRVNLNINNQPDTHPVQWMSIGIGTGGGTVTNVSVGGLSGLFTANVATPTSVPTVTYAPVSFSAHTFFGNCTSGSATPTPCQPNFTDLAGTASTSQLPGVTVFTNQSNTYAVNQKQLFTAGSTTSGINVVPLSGSDPSSLASGDFWYRSDVGSGHLRLRDSSGGSHTIFHADDTLPFSQLSGTIANGQLMASPTFSGTVTAGTYVTLNSGTINAQSDSRGYTVGSNRCYGVSSTTSGAGTANVFLGSLGFNYITIGSTCGATDGTLAATDLKLGTKIVEGIHGPSVGGQIQTSDGTGTAADYAMYDSNGQLTDSGYNANTVHGTIRRFQLSDNTGTSGSLAKFDANGNISDTAVSSTAPTFSGTVTGGALATSGTATAPTFATKNSGVVNVQSDTRGFVSAQNKCLGFTATSSATDSPVAYLGSIGTNYLTVGSTCGGVDGTFAGTDLKLGTKIVEGIHGPIVGGLIQASDGTGTAANYAMYDSNGQLTDSGYSANTVHGTIRRFQLSDNTGTSGNISKFDANGNLTDGGIAASGIVTSVSASSPLISSGGVSPAISVTAGSDGQCLNTSGASVIWGSCAGTAGEQALSNDTTVTAVNAATTSTQNLGHIAIGGAGTLNIAGRTVKVTAAGELDMTNGTNARFLLALEKTDGTILYFMLANLAFNNSTGSQENLIGWNLSSTCVTTTTGTSGAVKCWATGTIGDSVNFTIPVSTSIAEDNSSGTAVNLTQALRAEVLVAFSTASVSNLAKQKFIQVEQLK